MTREGAIIEQLWSTQTKPIIIITNHLFGQLLGRINYKEKRKCEVRY
jgi:hypothetical protein